MTAQRSSPTVAEFAARYVREYAGPPFHARKNVAHADAVLRLYVLPELGQIPLREVEPKHLAALQRKLFAQGLALNTVKGALQSVWGSLWKAARTEGLVAGKPHAEIQWPVNAPQAEPYTAVERDAVVAFFEKNAPKYAILVGCTFLAGMRPSEAAGLRRGDIDLESGDVIIRQAIASGEVTRGKTKKSARAIRVSPRLLSLARKHMPTWLGSHELVTTTRFGRPVDSQQWGSYWFAKCCSELNLEYRGYYHGRHTYISLALMNQADPVELSEFCGVSLPTMFRYYWRWMGGVSDPVESARKRGQERAGKATTVKQAPHEARA